MALWEVSIVFDTASRYVTHRDVLQDQLASAWLEAQARIRDGSYIHPAWKTGAVAITRMDATLEARRAKWEADFYDIDKRGYRRRRYKKPAIEREWEDMVIRDRKAATAAQKVSNDTYKQRRG
jgi:predicted NAD/FAD-binding protein